MKQNKKICNQCSEEIPLTAKLCSHCGKYQNRFRNWLSAVPIAISIILLILSLGQYLEAKKERVKAGDALTKADNALIKANEVKTQNEAIYDTIKIINESIKNTSIQLKKLGKYSLENSYILASESFLAMGGEKEAKTRLETNMDSMGHLLILSPLEEKTFWNSMGDLFKNRRH